MSLLMPAELFDCFVAPSLVYSLPIFFFDAEKLLRTTTSVSALTLFSTKAQVRSFCSIFSSRNMVESTVVQLLSLLMPTELFDFASSLMLWLLIFFFDAEKISRTTTSVSALTLFSTDVFCCINASLVHWLILLLVDVVVDMVLSKTNKRRTQVQESKQARKKKKLIFYRIYIKIYGKQREFIKKECGT